MALPPNRDPYQTRLSDLMETHVAMPENAPASEVFASLGRNPAVFITPVGSHQLIGIVTKGDLVKLEGGKGLASLKASDVASRSLIGILPTGTVAQALRILDGENQLKTALTVLPVVNANKEIQGIITRARLNKFLENWNSAQQNRGSISY